MQTKQVDPKSSFVPFGCTSNTIFPPFLNVLFSFIITQVILENSLLYAWWHGPEVLAIGRSLIVFFVFFSLMGFWNWFRTRIFVSLLFSFKRDCSVFCEQETITVTRDSEVLSTVCYRHTLGLEVLQLQYSSTFWRTGQISMVEFTFCEHADGLAWSMDNTQHETKTGMQFIVFSMSTHELSLSFWCIFPLPWHCSITHM